MRAFIYKAQACIPMGNAKISSIETDCIDIPFVGVNVDFGGWDQRYKYVTAIPVGEQKQWVAYCSKDMTTWEECFSAIIDGEEVAYIDIINGIKAQNVKYEKYSTEEIRKKLRKE